MSDDTTPRKGLRLHVYRASSMGDCTNGGITAAADYVTVTGVRYTSSHRRGGVVDALPRDMQVFPPSDGAPEVTLVIRENGRVNWLHLEPAAPCPAGRAGYMDGGNYAATTGSRWSSLTGDGRPVAVHDRSEESR
jgi:hypothetical protein